MNCDSIRKIEPSDYELSADIHILDSEMSNFRPAKCCSNCTHKISNHCKFDIPDKAIPGVPQGITMRNAVCDLFKWPVIEDEYNHKKGGE